MVPKIGLVAHPLSLFVEVDGGRRQKGHLPLKKEAVHLDFFANDAVRVRPLPPPFTAALLTFVQAF